ncbi:MAG: hypothetical protein WCJ76_08750 [Comamonadaceae bacterium]
MTTTTMTRSPAAALVAEGLSPQLQRHIDRTLAADRKGGEALWEKACAVADARADAQHGEWGKYLEATKQDERATRRLIAIAERGRADSRFRDAVITGFLNFTVAAITAQADDQLLTTLMEFPTPPTRREAQALGANPAPVPDLLLAPPVVPVAAAFDPLTEPLTEEECAALSLLGGFEQDPKEDSFTPAGFRLVTLTDTRHPDGWTSTTRSVGAWRHVLAQLREEAERKATITITTNKGPKRVQALRQTEHIALTLFEGKYSITHIASGGRVGDLYTNQAKAEADFDQMTGLDWTDMRGETLGEQLRSQIKAVMLGTGGKTVVPHPPVVPVAAPVAAPMTYCMHCGYAELSTPHHCGSCYLLIEAQKCKAGSEEMRWQLVQAAQATQKMPADLRRARMAEIRGVAEANQIDLDAPIIAAPIKMPAEAPIAKAVSRPVLLAHCEALLSGLIEHCSESEKRLLLALFDGEYLIPGEYEVWLAGHILLDNLPTPTLRWVETGKEDVS